MPTFIDTNVFLYAAGAPSPMKEPCIRVLREAATGRLAAITDTEVVQEILYVLTRRNERAGALKLARNALALFPGMIEVGAAEMESACGLLDRDNELPVRDAVHLACMIRRGVKAVISSDKHFGCVSEVERVDPLDAPGMERLLRESERQTNP